MASKTAEQELRARQIKRWVDADKPVGNVAQTTLNHVIRIAEGTQPKPDEREFDEIWESRPNTFQNACESVVNWDEKRQKEQSNRSSKNKGGGNKGENKETQALPSEDSGNGTHANDENSQGTSEKRKTHHKPQTHDGEQVMGGLTRSIAKAVGIDKGGDNSGRGEDDSGRGEDSGGGGDNSGGDNGGGEDNSGGTGSNSYRDRHDSDRGENEERRKLRKASGGDDGDDHMVDADQEQGADGGNNGEGDGNNQGEGDGDNQGEGDGSGSGNYEDNDEGSYSNPEGDDWNPEPEGYDASIPVQVDNYRTYYYNKVKDQHWCQAWDPDLKRSNWGRIEGLSWGVRQAVIVSFHPKSGQSGKPRRYYGFKQSEISLPEEHEIPRLLMASAEQIKAYKKDKDRPPDIIGAAWDYDKKGAERQTSTIRRVIFQQDLTGYGMFAKGPNTRDKSDIDYARMKFSKQAWISVSTVKPAMKDIESRYNAVLGKAEQMSPEMTRDSQTRKSLQQIGVGVAKTSIAGHVLLQNPAETDPARMLPSPYRPYDSIEIESLSSREPSLGISREPAQENVETGSVRSRSREPPAPAGVLRQSVEADSVRSQSEGPSGYAQSSRSQSEGPSVFSQAGTETGSVRSDSEGPFEELLVQSIREGSIGAHFQKANRRITAGRQVHFED